MGQNVEREMTIVYSHGGQGGLQLTDNVGGTYTPPVTIGEIGWERSSRLGIEGTKSKDAMDGGHYRAPDIQAGFAKSDDLALNAIFLGDKFKTQVSSGPKCFQGTCKDIEFAGSTK